MIGCCYVNCLYNRYVKKIMISFYPGDDSVLSLPSRTDVSRGCVTSEPAGPVLSTLRAPSS